VTLEEQNRSLWDQKEIAEGLALLESALRQGARSEYALQAAIAALHARSKPEDTDWRQITCLYDMLLREHPSPVVELNRAAAVAMADGPRAGLSLLDKIEAEGQLSGYHLLPAARADLLRRDGQWIEAAEAYRQALALVTTEPERLYLTRRLGEVEQCAVSS
jgi:RNA polymerase sigma-70 factor (ECF subfamily)